MRNKWQSLTSMILLGLMVGPFAYGELVIQDPFMGLQRGLVPIAVPPPSSSTERAVDSSRDGFQDTVEFLNGDKLHGTLMSIKPEEHGIRWQHVNVKQPIDFSMKGIARITLGKRSPEAPTTHTARIRLSNGDILMGNVVSLSDQSLVFDTSYSGKIEIKRTMLETISPDIESTSVLYQGPTGLDGWVMSQPDSWQFKKGALYATQQYPIARDIEDMPPMVNFEFKLAWRMYPQFNFTFFSDNLQSASGNCYFLQVSGQTVYFYRCDQNGGTQRIGRINLEQFQPNKTAHAKFNILVDKTKKAFSLLIDGVMVQQWVDPASFAGLGNAILFQPQTQGNMKISDISVTRWDGKVPQVESDEEPEKQDFVRFINDDKISGNLQSIDGGQAKFATSYAVLDVPLERIVQVSLSADNAEMARRNSGDIRAHFEEAGEITVNLVDLEAGMIRGNSENFGEIMLPVEALRTLEFNIYEEKSGVEGDAFDF